jgi:hypothetical protein
MIYKLVSDRLLRCLQDTVSAIKCAIGAKNGIATLDSTGNVPADQLANAGGGGGAVSSVFGRTGTVVASSGDYTFAEIGSKPTTLAGYGITNGQTTLSLTTTGTSGASTLASSTINIPEYQGALTLTTTGTSGASTLSGNTLNIPQYSGGSSGVSSFNTRTGAVTLTESDTVTALGFTPTHVFNIVDYGAKGDGKRITDVVTNATTTITSATANFTSADVGKSIRIWNAGASSHDFVTTIASITNSTTAVLTAAASQSINPTVAVYGTDNTTAIQNTILAASPTGGTIWIPIGVFCVAGPIITSYAGANPNAQIYMPVTIFDTPSSFNTRSHYVIQGEVKPNHDALDTVTTSFIMSPSLEGSIIYSMINGPTTNTTQGPAVFGTQGNDSGNTDINENFFTFKDLTIIVGQDVNNGGPTLGGINMWYSASCICDTVMVSVDGTSENSVLPTNEVAGIILSKINALVWSRATNSTVWGFKYGFIGSDGVCYDNALAGLCDKAYVFAANEEVAFATVLRAYYCRTWIYSPTSAILDGMVASTAGTYITIQHIYGELYATGYWFDYTNLLDDAGNAIHGDIHYTTLEGGNAAGWNVLPFTFNGGTAANVYQVGLGQVGSSTGLTSYELLNTNASGGAFMQIQNASSTVAVGMSNASAAFGNGRAANSGWVYSTFSGGLNLIASIAPIYFTPGGATSPKAAFTSLGGLSIGGTTPSSYAAFSSTFADTTGGFGPTIYPGLILNNTSTATPGGSSYNQSGITLGAHNNAIYGQITCNYGVAATAPFGVQGLIISTGTADPISFAPHNTEAMRLFSSGNLVIGSTTDNGSNLQVTGVETITNNALGTTVTSGLTLQNTTAAATGAQQISPAIHFQGQGWKTLSTAGSEPIDWWVYALPVQGSSTPGGDLVFAASLNSGSVTNVLTLNDGSGATVIGSIGCTSNIFTGTGGGFAFGTGATTAQLYSDASYTLNVRNGTNACQIQVDNTYTSTSNYEGGIFGFITNTNELSIGTTTVGGTIRNTQFVGGTVNMIATAIKRTTVSDAAYSVLTTDYLIAYTTLTAARTVTLPTAVGVTGQEYIIKDESGNAVTNHITIATTSSQTIDGASTASIITAYGVVRVYSNGAQWFTW